MRYCYAFFYNDANGKPHLYSHSGGMGLDEAKRILSQLRKTEDPSLYLMRCWGRQASRRLSDWTPC
jgi:hypothetical protein